MAARRRRPAVLVYHPDDAEAYARYVNVPRGSDVAAPGVKHLTHFRGGRHGVGLSHGEGLAI